MLTEKSILRCLIDNLDAETGELPEEFQLPRPGADGEASHPVLFADGALDGIQMYHTMSHGASSRTMEEFREVLELVSGGEMERAEALLVRCGQRDSACCSARALLDMVIESWDTIDTGKLSIFARSLMGDSDDRECVKYGICLLSLFAQTEQDETARVMLEILARSDEFTYYILFVVRDWKDGNEIVLHIAQHVHGWGRIHAVEVLEPETEEIREWLMTEGFLNNILPEYSALTCLKKSGAQKKVHSELTAEEFTGIGYMITLLMDEDFPFTGIWQLENYEEFLLAYMDRCPGRMLSSVDCIILKIIREYCRERMEWKRDLEEVYERCRMALYSAQARDAVMHAVEEGDRSVMGLAWEMRLPYQNILLERMRSDFEEYSWDCRYFHEEKWADDILEIYHRNMPPEAVAAYTETTTFWNRDIPDNGPLRDLFEYLPCAPGKGTEYVREGLISRSKYCREGATEVLTSWVGLTGRPLRELSEELYEVLHEAAGRETEMDIAYEMWSVLDAGIDSGDPEESGRSEDYEEYEDDMQDARRSLSRPVRRRERVRFHHASYAAAPHCS